MRCTRTLKTLRGRKRKKRWVRRRRSRKSKRMRIRIRMRRKRHRRQRRHSLAKRTPDVELKRQSLIICLVEETNAKESRRVGSA